MARDYHGRDPGERWPRGAPDSQGGQFAPGVTGTAGWAARVASQMPGEGTIRATTARRLMRYVVAQRGQPTRVRIAGHFDEYEVTSATAPVISGESQIHLWASGGRMISALTPEHEVFVLDGNPSPHLDEPDTPEATLSGRTLGVWDPGEQTWHTVPVGPSENLGDLALGALTAGQQVEARMPGEDWRPLLSVLTSDNPDTPGMRYLYAADAAGRRQLYASVDLDTPLDLRVSGAPQPGRLPEPDPGPSSPRGPGYEWQSQGRFDIHDISDFIVANEPVQILNTLGQWDEVVSIDTDAGLIRTANDDQPSSVSDSREVRMLVRRSEPPQRPEPTGDGSLEPVVDAARRLAAGEGLQARLNGEWSDLASITQEGRGYRVAWANGGLTSVSGPQSAIRVRPSGRPHQPPTPTPTPVEHEGMVSDLQQAVQQGPVEAYLQPLLAAGSTLIPGGDARIPIARVAPTGGTSAIGAPLIALYGPGQDPERDRALAVLPDSWGIRWRGPVAGLGTEVIGGGQAVSGSHEPGPDDQVSFDDMEDMAGDGVFGVPLAYARTTRGRLVRILAFDSGAGGGGYHFNMEAETPGAGWDPGYISGSYTARGLIEDAYGGVDDEFDGVTWYNQAEFVPAAPVGQYQPPSADHEYNEEILDAARNIADAIDAGDDVQAQLDVYHARPSGTFTGASSTTIRSWIASAAIHQRSGNLDRAHEVIDDIAVHLGLTQTFTPPAGRRTGGNAPGSEAPRIPAVPYQAASARLEGSPSIVLAHLDELADIDMIDPNGVGAPPPIMVHLGAGYSEPGWHQVVDRSLDGRSIELVLAPGSISGDTFWVEFDDQDEPLPYVYTDAAAARGGFETRVGYLAQGTYGPPTSLEVQTRRGWEPIQSWEIDPVANTVTVTSTPTAPGSGRSRIVRVSDEIIQIRPRQRVVAPSTVPPMTVPASTMIGADTSDLWVLSPASGNWFRVSSIEQSSREPHGVDIRYPEGTIRTVLDSDDLRIARGPSAPAPPAGTAADRFRGTPPDQLPGGADSIADMADAIRDASLGWGSGPIPITPELERRFRAIWDYDDPGTGFSTRITRMSVDPSGTIEVGGMVYDANGGAVGNWTRNMYPSVSGRGGARVYHAYFSMQHGSRGGGFTTRWFEQALEGYRKEGFTEVSVHANIDVGGYTWTRWFDFEDRFTAQRVLQEMSDAAFGAGSYSLSAETKEEIRRVRERFNAGEHVTAREIALIGRRQADADVLPRATPTDPNGDPIPMWFGKAFMLGRSWHGMMRL